MQFILGNSIVQCEQQVASPIRFFLVQCFLVAIAIVPLSIMALTIALTIHVPALRFKSVGFLTFIWNAKTVTFSFPSYSFLYLG